MKAKFPIHITIEYKLTDSIDWKSLELTHAEYFELEPDEEVELDSLPKYNHAIEYLELERHQVAATRIILIDEALKAKRSIVEKFWNQGENRLIERTDIGENQYWEMILEVQVSKKPPLWEIVRVGREDGVLTPWYHAFLQDNDDGSQTEIKVDTDASSEYKQSEGIPALEKSDRSSVH